MAASTFRPFLNYSGFTKGPKILDGHETTELKSTSLTVAASTTHAPLTSRVLGHTRIFSGVNTAGFTMLLGSRSARQVLETGGTPSFCYPPAASNSAYNSGTRLGR
ncbi:hypothetical protein OPT61_g3011 [Boeremia exigua]|uniref:Uncharacterized protein n=1 Tax=Boeremia exigua TaxID=749465 RepID=A0ACC2IJK1_9PLEO|nr:hypothetical protein OPT61_g3011 [Boeremia exigua]